MKQSTEHKQILHCLAEGLLHPSTPQGGCNGPADNARLAIMLPPSALYMPFAVFWMRIHSANAPAVISAAACVDGATTWDDLFWRIHLPHVRAPIASLGKLISVWTWNQLLPALVLAEDPTQRTIVGALGAFQGHYATNVPLLCTGTRLTPATGLTLFLFHSKKQPKTPVWINFFETTDRYNGACDSGPNSWTLNTDRGQRLRIDIYT